MSNGQPTGSAAPKFAHPPGQPGNVVQRGNGGAIASPTIFRSADALVQLIENERSKAAASAAPELAGVTRRLHEQERLVQQLILERDSAKAEATRLRNELNGATTPDMALRVALSRFCIALASETDIEGEIISNVINSEVAKNGDFVVVFDTILRMLRERPRPNGQDAKS